MIGYGGEFMWGANTTFPSPQTMLWYTTIMHRPDSSLRMRLMNALPPLYSRALLHCIILLLCMLLYGASYTACLASWYQTT